MLFNVFNFLYIVSAVLAVSLNAIPLNGGPQLHLGSFHNLEFVQSNFLDVGVEYCIGSDDLEGHQCFSVYKANKEKENIHFIVEKGEQDEITKVSINTVQNSDIVSVVKPNIGPIPIMNPVSLNKNTKKPFKPAKKIVKEGENGKGEEGEEGEEEEEDNRSFIQKNWMYIVPVLLLVMAGLGEEKQA